VLPTDPATSPAKVEERPVDSTTFLTCRQATSQSQQQIVLRQDNSESSVLMVTWEWSAGVASLALSASWTVLGSLLLHCAQSRLVHLVQHLDVSGKYASCCIAVTTQCIYTAASCEAAARCLRTAPPSHLVVPCVCDVQCTTIRAQSNTSRAGQLRCGGCTIWPVSPSPITHPCNCCDVGACCIDAPHTVAACDCDKQLSC
jgi:hypothetical protein